jgi:hypothetical protein
MVLKNGDTVPLRLLDCLSLLVGFAAWREALFGVAGAGGLEEPTDGGESRIADGEGILMCSMPSGGRRTWTRDADRHRRRGGGTELVVDTDRQKYNGPTNRQRPIVKKRATGQ